MDTLDNFVPLPIKYRNMKIYQGPTESLDKQKLQESSALEKKKKKGPLSKDASNTGQESVDLLWGNRVTE